jgi:cyclopropane fatty-acyl-phospholipid synthase-like methyltransferase
MTTDARGFFTGRHATYARFIRAMRYPQGLRAFWLASPLLRPGLRILDAGCGTGALTLAVWDACQTRGMRPAAFHAFDLTPAMLDHLRATLQRRALDGITLAEANVLHLESLPASWRDYDLVVSASMLEYVPRDRFADALAGLRARLRPGGRFTLFITRRNPLTRLLIGRWWASNLYTRAELAAAFATAGFSDVAFRRFPIAAWHLAPWGHVVEAARSPASN